MYICIISKEGNAFSFMIHLKIYIFFVNQKLTRKTIFVIVGPPGWSTLVQYFTSHQYRLGDHIHGNLKGRNPNPCHYGFRYSVKTTRQVQYINCNVQRNPLDYNLFPLNSCKIDTRAKKKFKEYQCRTTKYYNSAVPAMTRQLNQFMAI